MGSAAEDVIAEENMMWRAYKDLRDKHPEHELLRFLKPQEGDIFHYTPQFWETYEEAGDHNIHTLNRYATLLKQAAGKFVPPVPSQPRLEDDLVNPQITDSDDPTDLFLDDWSG